MAHPRNGSGQAYEAATVPSRSSRDRKDAWGRALDSHGPQADLCTLPPPGSLAGFPGPPRVTARGAFLYREGPVANRVTFLVDGFNLHYSLLEAQSLLGIARLRWLNADALLGSYLDSIRLRRIGTATFP